MLAFNRLLVEFRNVADGQVVNVDALVPHHHYPVGAREVTNRYGFTIMLTMHSVGAICFKIFLPKRYADCFVRVDVEDINTGRKKYKLIYLGNSGLTCILHLQEKYQESPPKNNRK